MKSASAIALLVDRTQKQKEAIKKLVEMNRRRRAGNERLEEERVEEIRNDERGNSSIAEKALEKLRKRARARREKKYKSTNDTRLDQYMK